MLLKSINFSSHVLYSTLQATIRDGHLCATFSFACTFRSYLNDDVWPTRCTCLYFTTSNDFVFMIMENGYSFILFIFGCLQLHFHFFHSCNNPNRTPCLLPALGCDGITCIALFNKLKASISKFSIFLQLNALVQKGGAMH